MFKLFSHFRGIGIGEAVNRSRIGDEFKISACRCHLLLERLNLIRRDELVIGSVEHEDLCFDVTG